MSPTVPLLRRWRATVVLGVVGTTAVAVGGTLAGGGGAPGTDDPWLWTVPTVPVQPRASLLPSLLLFYGGLVLLTRAWLRLRASVTAGRAVGCRIVLVVFALWALPLLLGPPLASRDVYSYAAVGELAAQGLDPYEVGPAALDDGGVLDAVDPAWRQTPTPYGPAFLSLARLAAGAADPLVAVLAFRGLALAGLALVAWSLPRLAALAGGRAEVALVLVLCNPLTLLHLVSGAHNEALMVGLLATGIALAHRSGATGSDRGGRPGQPNRARPAARHWAGVGLCALAAAIKVPAVLGALWLAWTRPPPGSPLRARVASTAAGGLAVLGVVGLVSEVSGYGWGWATTSTTAAEVGAYLSPTWLLGALAEHASALAGSGSPETAATAVRLLGLVVATALVARLLGRSHLLGLRGLAVALVAVALLLPAVHPWYLAWGLVLMGAVGTAERARWFVVVSVVMSFAVLPGGPGLGAQLTAVWPVWAIAAGIGLLAPLTFRLAPPGPRRVASRVGAPEVSVLVAVAPGEPVGSGSRLAQVVADVRAELAGRSAEVVAVVDGDDTMAASLEEAAELRVLHRDPVARWGGRDGAVADGLRRARGRWTVVVEPDLAHPGEAVATLLAARAGVDLVVGERPRGAPALLLARMAFPHALRHVDDLRAPTFAVRTDAVDPTLLHPDGAGLLLELLATHPGLARATCALPASGPRPAIGGGQALRDLGHVLELRIRTAGPWRTQRGRAVTAPA